MVHHAKVGALALAGLLVLHVFPEAQTSHPLLSVGAPQEAETYNPFPALYLTENQETSPETAPIFSVPREGDIPKEPSQEWRSLLLNNDILAFYGHPHSRMMGILGRYSIPDLDARLSALAAEYRVESGGRGVKKAFYIIFGTVWPQGEIGIIKESTLEEYIQYGLNHNILIFIDHQIGRYDPISALKRMLPYLKYPNVHLALDPEWRTQKPMEEIGYVTAEELNEAQRVMEAYMIENNISGERMLVVHQFNWRMISRREQVTSGFERVRLIHCADGFGPPHMKRDAYAFNAQAANIPIKAFKLFYNFNIPGAGYDDPLLSPREVYQLNPRPYLIMYQ